MIDKNTFIEIVDGLVEGIKKHRKLIDGLYDLLGTFPEETPFDSLASTIVTVLENTLEPNEKYPTLGWWLWEVEGWRYPEKSFMRDKDGNDIFIRNTGELYDVIVSD